MSTTYSTDNVAGIEEMTIDVMERYHGDLKEAGVKVSVVKAFNEVGAPIKVNGHRAIAKIKINSLSDRAEGKADATITIDGRWWQNHQEEDHTAVLDHELQHLVLMLERKSGDVKEDDLGRPRLKMRHHDWELGGFEIICNRHGDHAPEQRAFAKVNENYFRQLVLPFVKADEVGPKAKAAKAKRKTGLNKVAAAPAG